MIGRRTLGLCPSEPAEGSHHGHACAVWARARGSFVQWHSRLKQALSCARNRLLRDAYAETHALARLGSMLEYTYVEKTSRASP